MSSLSREVFGQHILRYILSSLAWEAFGLNNTFFPGLNGMGSVNECLDTLCFLVAMG